MEAQNAGGMFTVLFGIGKGSGAACFFFALWIVGIAVCLLFRGDKTIGKMESI